MSAMGLRGIREGKLIERQEEYKNRERWELAGARDIEEVKNEG